MKKLLVLMAVVATMFPARAEDEEKFQFGMKLGMVMATQNYEGKENDEDLKQLIGPTAGFFGEIPINKYLEIRPELLFASQGRRWKGDSYEKVIRGGQPMGEYKYVSTEAWGYLQIPILAKAKYGNEKIGGFVNFGPQFGVGLFGKWRYRWELDGEKEKESGTLKFDEEGLKRFDAGLAIGLGMECNKTGVEVEARYYVGLSDLVDWDSYGIERPDNYDKTTNRGFNFTVGWKF